MENVVVKVSYNGDLRRTTVPKSATSFSELRGKIQSMFALDTSNLTIIYEDSDGDMVTMAEEHDLMDALVNQSLNPLRIIVKSAVSPAPATPTVDPAADAAAKAAAVQREFAARAAAASAAAQAAAETAVKSAQEAVAQQLENVLKEVGAEAHPYLDSLLKTAPAKIVEVMNAVRACGFEASFEPVISKLEAELAKGAKAKEDKAFETKVQNDETAVKEEVEKEAGKEQKDVKDVPVKPAEVRKEEAKRVRDPTLEGVKHIGVQCDGCGQHPIFGPRFKSLVKADYDLCQGCYAKHGVEGEYTAIERPLCRPRGPMAGHFPWMHNRPMHGISVRPGPTSFGGRPFHEGPRVRTGCPRHMMDVRTNLDGKLDSRFVKDVSIFDGTVVAPNADFTKIWRLRNSGNVPWPPMTHLVHVGGDLLSENSFVPLLLPEGGLAPNEETEVAVDMKAPSVGGRYVSHWRLVSPGGSKFGHRVWAMIQVASPEESSTSVAAAAFGSTSAPPEASADAKAQQTVAQPSPAPAADVSSDSAAESEKATATAAANTQPAETVEAPAPVEEPKRSPTVQYPIVIPVLEKAAAPSTVADLMAEAASVPAPVVVKSDNDVAPSEHVADEAVVVPHASDSPKTEDTSVGGFSLVEHPRVETAPALTEEQEKVKQLAAMGFTDEALNLHVLAEHKWDVQAAVEVLVKTQAESWDTLMEDLEEMGFNDRDVNRRVLLKNNGSVRHAIKDLVEMKYRTDMM